MKIQAGKKIIPEEFPSEQRDMAKRLSQIVNPFLDQIVQAANGQLSLKDNLKTRIYQITLAADVSAAKIPWENAEKPTGLFVAQLLKSVNRENVSQVFSISWSYNEKVIDVSFIGLQAATKHDAVLIAIV